MSQNDNSTTKPVFTGSCASDTRSSFTPVESPVYVFPSMSYASKPKENDGATPSTFHAARHVCNPSSHHTYDYSDAPTPVLAFDGDTAEDTFDATRTEELLYDPMSASTQSLPATILPELVQPFESPSRQPGENGGEEETKVAGQLLQDTSDEIMAGFRRSDGRYSAVAKGKWKARPEVDSPAVDSVEGKEKEPDVPGVSRRYAADSTNGWVTHNEPILKEYADRQVSPPLGRRVNVSLNNPSQFIEGSLQLLVNRNNEPANDDTSRQLRPQLLENFTDVHRWAEEYFRARLGMGVHSVGHDVPVLLTIIANNFYEAHMYLTDRICEAAIRNMRTRGGASLDVEDFAFGFDLSLSQEMPFVVESSSRIRDTIEQHRPRSPVDIPPPQSTTTRSGRQSKMSKQARAAAKEDHEKQTKAKQREREKQKKQAEEGQQQNQVTPVQVARRARARGRAQSTPDPPVTASSTAGAVLRTPSAAVYHTPNHGLSGEQDPGIIPQLVPGMICHACGRVVPHSAEDVTSLPGTTSGSHPSRSQRNTSRQTPTSNLSLPPLNAEPLASTTQTPASPRLPELRLHFRAAQTSSLSTPSLLPAFDETTETEVTQIPRLRIVLPKLNKGSIESSQTGIGGNGDRFAIIDAPAAACRFQGAQPPLSIGKGERGSERGARRHTRGGQDRGGARGDIGATGFSRADDDASPQEFSPINANASEGTPFCAAAASTEPRGAPDSDQPSGVMVGGTSDRAIRDMGVITVANGSRRNVQTRQTKKRKLGLEDELV